MMLVLSVSLVISALLVGGCVGKEIEASDQQPLSEVIEDTTLQEATNPTQENYICMVYFAGIGCSHCEKVTPLILEQLPRDYPNLVIIEYEIYEQEQNAPLFDEYVSAYHTTFELPLIIFNQDQHVAGDASIEKNTRTIVEELDSNQCPLIDGTSQDFKDLDPTSLPGYPRIWHQEKVLLKMGPEGDGELLKRLLVDDNLADALKDVEYRVVEPTKVAIPGKNIEFDNGILIDHWVLQWNGEVVGIPPPQGEILPPEVEIPQPEVSKPSLTLPKVLSLAAVDSVNPCAFAVLLMMLVSVMLYNPGNRRSILFAGLAFVASVFVMYFLYGLVFIKLFQVIQALSIVRFWFSKVLAGGAIAFGVLNIRDFIKYKPGRLGTEMPLFMRPKVKRLLSKVTSTKGAFLTGIIVTVFLLPCTIGPYIIAAGILSVFDMLQNVPILLLYNLVFVAPMLAIVGGIYLGLSKVQDVYQWKERNIGRLHLIAGIVIVGLGVALLLGLV